MYDVVVRHMDNTGLIDEAGFLFFWTRVIFLLISCLPIPTIVCTGSVGIWKVMKPLSLVDRFIQAEFDVNEFEICKRITMMFGLSTRRRLCLDCPPIGDFGCPSNCRWLLFRPSTYRLLLFGLSTCRQLWSFVHLWVTLVVCPPVATLCLDCPPIGAFCRSVPST